MTNKIYYSQIRKLKLLFKIPPWSPGGVALWPEWYPQQAGITAGLIYLIQRERVYFFVCWWVQDLRRTGERAMSGSACRVGNAALHGYGIEWNAQRMAGWLAGRPKGKYIVL